MILSTLLSKEEMLQQVRGKAGRLRQTFACFKPTQARNSPKHAAL
jgi:hypothetical protein